MSSKLLRDQVANLNPGARILSLEKRIEAIEDFLSEASEPTREEPVAEVIVDEVVLEQPVEEKKKRGRPPKKEAADASTTDQTEM